MWRATIKGVLARKIRLLLTALAVVLGVTFVSGTYVLTDTLKQSFGSLFSQFAAGTDLVVRSRAPFGDGEGTRERLASPLVTEVRKVPGVARGRRVPPGVRAVRGARRQDRDPDRGRADVRDLVERWRQRGGSGSSGRGASAGA